MSLHQQRSGAGEPLLLIHGIGSDLHAWDPVVRQLAETHEVIAIDLPGFGGSEPLAPGVVPTPAALAESVASHLDELGIERAHVAGHSLGGWIALELGLLGRALSVAAICPAGTWRRPLPPDHVTVTVQRLGRLGRPFIPLALRSPQLRRLVLGSFVGHPDRVPYPVAVHMARAHVGSAEYGRVSNAMRAAYFDSFDALTVPTVVVFGEIDRLLKPRSIEAPCVHTVVLPDCGHQAMWDAPDSTVEHIRSVASV